MAIPVMWRTQKARYSLQADVCPECERAVFPPRRLCPYCGRTAQASTAVEQKPVLEFAFFLPQEVEFLAAGDD
jgi:uncharacterized OB-fold protein